MDSVVPAVIPAAPPVKTADEVYLKSNPLRVPAKEQPIRQVADNSGRANSSQPVAPPAFATIQTAKREEMAKSETFPQISQNNEIQGNTVKPLSGFGSPDGLGSPQDNFMDSAFPEESVRKSPAANSTPQPLPVPAAEPKPLPVSMPDYDAAVNSRRKENIPENSNFPNRTPVQSLGNADPFGADPKPFQAEEASLPVASLQKELPIQGLPPQKSAGIPAQFAAGDDNAVKGGAGEGGGMPGPAALEGVQTPHLTLEKILPAEIVVEQPATIKTVIKNAGYSTAKEIIVRDRVPQGTRLLSTSPEAQTTANGELIWILGNLDAGGQAAVEMRVVPLREGEIGSVASVGYTADVSSRKIVTRPKIQVEVKAPQEIQLGETAQIEIIISNPGSATATGIVLEEYVPDGLYHKDGKILVNKNVDTLKPREAKKLILPLSCVGNGNLVNKVVITADGNLRAEEKTVIRALSPVLELDITGTKQCFLERKAEYKLTVANSGTSSAKSVDLKLVLPTSVQFVSTNQSGVYEASTHTVHWALEELPQKETGDIDLVLLPGKIGNYTMTFSGDNGAGLKTSKTQQLSIDGLSALSFAITGQPLLEAGREATYEVTVANKGTKPSENVRIRASFPDGLTFVRGEGPARYSVQGNNIQFEPLASLEPKGEKTYRITAKCASEGDHRISVQVISDELRSPITKEESTRVFK
ncbi:hypothetical protein FACS18942_07880 [Planctomycetales bacterium]|nr:hypothetical protein FACS18942_07880 [Planctomycetales bacterium]GHT34840.1 hypothetical protein FACS189427_02910 [Planctomycetales bacterium]